MYIPYKSETKPVHEVIQGVIPNGWSINDNAFITFARSIEMESATAFEVLFACANTYGITFSFDNKRRVITLVDPAKSHSLGVYFTDQLNLTELSFKGDTTQFATRLYARGKDGLTFASINGGKDYVDNNEYATKVVSVCWIDERYTVAESLLDDTRKKLAESSFPVRSYTCTAVDLARISAQYNFLDVKLHGIVTLIDRRRNTRIPHQVVEYKRYPKKPNQNVITLSNAAPRIESTVKNIDNKIKDVLIVQNNKTEQILEDIKKTIDETTNNMLGVNGGYFGMLLNSVTKKPYGFVIMDNEDARIAKNIWLHNNYGMAHSSVGIEGPYTAAWTQEGVFYADFIKAGKMSGARIEAGTIAASALSVAYKTTVSQEISDTAQSKVDAFKNGEFAKLSQDFTVANGKLSSNIELSKSNEIKWSNLSQSYDNISLEVGNKLNISEFSTKLSVSSDAVQIAWNGISQNIKFEGSWFYGGEMNIYDGAASSSKLISFGSSGMKLYRDNYTVGMIGTNRVGSDTSKKGLDFDLNYDGAYMAWAVQETPGSTSYTSKLMYSKQAFGGLSANQLHAGCDINMHGYKLLNPSFQDGGITGTINFVKVIGVSNDGTLSGWVADCSMEFKNGLLVSAGW